VIYGGIEAGGTKWVCAVGQGPEDLERVTVIPTTSPAETLEAAAQFFADDGDLAALGVGSFGPVDLSRGTITTTPKPGWANTEVVASLSAALSLPIAFDTDVNAAALGEARWGASVGLDTFCYITVGTGIGGGAMANGRLLHGLSHPEFGHMRVPHDRRRDPFDGVCPFHCDCLEGLASGGALEARWGRRSEELAEEDEVWALEAEYLAHGILNVVAILSPERVVLGGGVMQSPRLLDLVHERVVELAAGYFPLPEPASSIDDYIVRPALGDRSGVIGALELARLAVPG
jgi:fructokinase